MSRGVSRLFGALVLLAPVIPAFAQGLTVGNYKLISETVITRTTFRYSYTADVTNNGPAATGVSATVASTSPTTVINQNSLTFGNVAAGAVVTSGNTFTFTQDRTVQFDLAALHWTVQSSTGPQPPVANPGSNQSISLGATVRLNGSASTDPGGRALTYLWSFVSFPSTPP